MKELKKKGGGFFRSMRYTASLPEPTKFNDKRSRVLIDDNQGFEMICAFVPTHNFSLTPSGGEIPLHFDGASFQTNDGSAEKKQKTEEIEESPV